MSRKRTRTEGPAETILVENLPSDLRRPYYNVIRKLCPGVSVDFPKVVKDASDGALLLVETSSKHDAVLLQRRLQNANIFGRRWKTELVPSQALKPIPSPGVVEVTCSKPLEEHLIEGVLATLPGFLAVTANDEGQNRSFLATFADEGSCLHARALLSGRTHEGVHMFLSLMRQ
jgi:hypothetical protein